jgi:cytochrome c553
MEIIMSKKIMLSSTLFFLFSLNALAITSENINEKNISNKIEVNTDMCISCHGETFEKSAMGYSKIVREMSKKDIITSLSGYKNGTYGGDMTALMSKYAINLSMEEIEAMAEMIGE